MNKTNNMRAAVTYRHKLLATVSATALLGLVYSAAAHAGMDADRPLIWIDLGGQLDSMGGQPEPYVPPFAAVAAQRGLLPVENLQTPPNYSVGEEAAISFQPENSDWIFSASVQYGRSNSKKHRHQEIEVQPIYISNRPAPVRPAGPAGVPINQTAEYTVRSGDHHAIVDFQVGKDVGLGQLGHDSSGQLALGVRIAQFSASSSLNLRADPYPHLGSEYVAYFHKTIPALKYYQFYRAQPDISHKFSGLGPSLSWQGSVAMIGSESGGPEVTFDWGANLAALFGRQKTRIQHQTTGDIYTHNALGGLVGQPKYVHHQYVNNTTTERSRSVIVPNVGGLVGVSLKFPNAKVSLGYRADFFIGAMDGGIDARKSMTRSFNGPFASLSVGLGD